MLSERELNAKHSNDASQRNQSKKKEQRKFNHKLRNWNICFDQATAYGANNALKIE